MLVDFRNYSILDPSLLSLSFSLPVGHLSLYVTDTIKSRTCPSKEDYNYSVEFRDGGGRPTTRPRQADFSARQGPARRVSHA